jgi:hypothetical protein
MIATKDDLMHYIRMINQNTAGYEEIERPTQAEFVCKITHRICSEIIRIDEEGDDLS